MADDAGRRGWFDWLPWRGREPEPEPLLILGMEPFTALLVLVAVLGLAVAIYYRPRAVLTGFAEMLGSTLGFVVGVIAVGGIAVAGVAIVYDVSALAILAILAVVGLIALFGFLSDGGV